MSDDQNPQHDDPTSRHDEHSDHHSGHEELPAPAAPAPVYAASSKLPPMSAVPLTPVVGGGAALRPDGGGENVGQKPWFWLLVALVAVLIAAIVFTQCTGSDAPTSTSVPGLSGTESATDGTATTVGGANSTTSTTLAVTTTTIAPVATTAPPLATTPGTVVPSDLTPQQITGLQAQCVYGGDAASCATLTASGNGPDTNYGLGQTLTASDDATLSTQCTSGVDQLACLELASRHPASPNDQATAEEFAAAVVAGDIPTVQELAAPYVVQQVPQLTAGPYTGADIPGTNFNGGKFSFKVQPTGTIVCWVSSEVIVYCLVNPNG